jgi:S1-C subfamily serine protease
VWGDDDDAPDEPLDDRPSGARPDPVDRPWVHPAELQSFVATPQASPEPPRPREWVIGTLSALAGVAATLLVLVAFGVLGGRERSPIPPPVVTNPNSPVDYSAARRVADSAALSVVTVATNQPSSNGSAAGAEGSGVVLRTDRVLTSEHLVRGATEVEVSTKDGRSMTAQVIGTDPGSDLALLMVDGVGPEQPEPLRFDEPAIGDVVVALGAGSGNSGWVGIGVIQERNWLTSDNGVAIAGLLATGVPTTAATTGGGLFDTDGRLVGMLTSPPGATRAGLAVPIDVVTVVARQLEDEKQAAHGALAVAFDADVRGGRGGARLAAVAADGPAAVADPPLQKGDVVVRVGEADINGWRDLVGETRRRRPRDRVEIGFERNGRTLETVVELGPARPGVESPYGYVG